MSAGRLPHLNSVVLDASVLIAFFKDEHAERDVLGLIEGATISSVTLAEVLSVLRRLGLIESPGVDGVFALLAPVVPFSETQARIAAELFEPVRQRVLSLGDRACLALALEMDADVYTADRAWSRLSLPCRIHQVRGASDAESVQ